MELCKINKHETGIMKIFFDLDGTLIDSKQRLFRLFHHLVKEADFTFDAYWDLKRNKINHGEILKRYFSYSDQAIKEFEKIWMINIEQDEWLELDKPFEGVNEFLFELKKTHQLYLVTARQSELQALNQINRFGWQGIFDHVFVTSQKEEKAAAIQKLLKTNPADWMIGDTGKDVEAGKEMGINTAAVLSGFRNRADLETYKPTIIIDSVLDFKL